MNKKRQQGITLLELMIAIGIMSIIVAMAAPSFSDSIDRKRLISAAEQIMGHIQLARITAISTETPIDFVLDRDGVNSRWVYGFGLNDGTLSCDTSKTDIADVAACKVFVSDGDATIETAETAADGALDDTGDVIFHRYTNADHSSVTTVEGNGGVDVTISFDPIRGVTNGAVTIELTSSGGKRLDIRVGLLGDARICAPDNSTIEYTGC